MTYTPRFQVGDQVLVTGPFISGKVGPKVPRPGVVDQVDLNDSTWSYHVRLTWRNQEIGTWCHETRVQPAIKVPKFTTVEQADAWLQKHSPQRRSK